MHVLCIRHRDGSEDDRATSWCRVHGVSTEISRRFRGEVSGEMTGDLDAVVIYDGMDNACDAGRHPFLNEVYRRIDAVQFHAEQTICGLRRWQTISDSHGRPGARTPEEQEAT